MNREPIAELKADFLTTVHHVEDWLRQNGCSNMKICTDPFETAEHRSLRFRFALESNGLELLAMHGPPDQKTYRLYGSAHQPHPTP